MTDYVEGLPVLDPGSPLLHPWAIPDKNGKIVRTITLRNGSIGFCIAWVILRFHELVERLDINPGVIDEGGYSHRPITGGTGWSKHATGGAADLNWQRHPYDTPALATFTKAQVRKIRGTLRRCLGVIEWGGNWPSWSGSTAKTDSMHFQLASDKRLKDAERLARLLMLTPRGRRILAANPGQKAVIKS